MGIIILGPWMNLCEKKGWKGGRFLKEYFYLFGVHSITHLQLIFVVKYSWMDFPNYLTMLCCFLSLLSFHLVDDNRTSFTRILFIYSNVTCNCVLGEIRMVSRVTTWSFFFFHEHEYKYEWFFWTYHKKACVPWLESKLSTFMSACWVSDLLVLAISVFSFFKKAHVVAISFIQFFQEGTCRALSLEWLYLCQGEKAGSV